MRRTAFGIAESAIVDVQLSKAANQSAPVHAQYSGGLALIPVDISENDKNKLLFEFFQRLVIQDACSVHSARQSLKLDFVAYVCFRPMFNPERLLHPFVTKSAGVCAAQAECDANHCVYRFPTLAWCDGQLRKKGAFRCEPLPRYRTLHL